jgi:hypothetical protein
MKPVNQKVISQGKGDCWRCCIASILELNADDVPNFVGDSDHSKGIIAEDLARKWLAERGLFILEIYLHNDLKWYCALNWTHLRNVYCIMSVPSQKFPGGSHAVVGQFVKDKQGTELRVVHDPNPENEAYDHEVKISRLQFIVPFKLQIN